MRTIEQPRIELLFKLPHLKGNRRLSHEERLGRLSEREMLRNRVEAWRHRPPMNSKPCQRRPYSSIKRTIHKATPGPDSDGEPRRLGHIGITVRFRNRGWPL